MQPQTYSMVLGNFLLRALCSAGMQLDREGEAPLQGGTGVRNGNFRMDVEIARGYLFPGRRGYRKHALM